MRWLLPVPAGSRHQPAHRPPLRADSCATLRSLSLCRSPFHDVFEASPDSRAGPSIRTGWYVTVAKLPLETPMRSTSFAVARRAQGFQPVRNISDPRFYHFRILSIFGQRTIAFDHRNQEAGGVGGFHVAANDSLGLALSQDGGNALAPVIEDCLQSLPKSRVKRRHFLRQIVQLTAAAYILGPNGQTLNNADQSLDRVPVTL